MGVVSSRSPNLSRLMIRIFRIAPYIFAQPAGLKIRSAAAGYFVSWSAAKVTAAIRAFIAGQFRYAIATKGALKRADHGLGRIGAQITITTLATGPHLQHYSPIISRMYLGAIVPKDLIVSCISFNLPLPFFASKSRRRLFTSVLPT